MKNTLVLTVLIMLIISSFTIEAINPSVDVSTDTILEKSRGPNLLFRTRTKEWIYSTQQLASNNGTSVDQIYFRLGAIKYLDPTLSQVPQSLKDHWGNQIISFQNADGGFGAWKYDRSGMSSTRRAVEVLSWLGMLDQINTADVAAYLDSIRNALTNGFNSNSKDSDADTYTTALAVETYNLLGEAIANQTLVENVFIRAENNDVNLTDFGGYGLQTNNQKNIFWKSEVTVTHAAINTLDLLSVSYNASSALTFLKSMQGTDGGFYNDITLLSGEKISYTGSAISTIYKLNGTPTNIALAQQYIQNLEDTNTGAFKFSTKSVEGSVIGTFFALESLQAMSLSPTNTTKTLDYLINQIPDNGGFGAAPGEDASLRETFDAVAALTAMGKPILNQAKLLSFLESYRNPDGGYGLKNSYTESTLRVAEIYDMLGEPFPNPSQTISFLQGLQQLDGGFTKGAGKTVSYTISTYRATRALQILGATPSNTANAIMYIKSVYNSTNGGYGGFFGDITDISSTYRAVRTLTILNDTTIEKAKIASFIKGSQNPDGGFKRSTYDNSLPKNASSSVYTYSAMRALLILGEKPTNMTGVYNYLESTRNKDGGYSKHPFFTSDIAYTFTNLWVLSSLNSISPFQIEVFSDISQIGNETQQLELGFSGDLVPINYNITYGGLTEFNASTINSSGNVTIGLPGLSNGNHSVNIYATDLALHVINETFTITIVDQAALTTTPTSTNPTSNLTSNPTSAPTSSAPASSAPATSAPAGDSSAIILFAGVLGGVLLLIILPLIFRRNKR